MVLNNLFPIARKNKIIFFKFKIFSTFKPFFILTNNSPKKVCL